MSAAVFSPIARRYDLLNDLVSLGLHRRWKRRLVKSALRFGAPERQTVDLATGTGDVARLLRESIPESRTVVGIDPCPQMLEVARDRGGKGIEWRSGHAESLPLEEGAVDLLTCAFGVRNFLDRGAAFREWRRVLSAGGVVAVLEIHPLPQSWYRPLLALYWNRVMPLVGALSGSRESYRYLRDSARGFITPSELAREARAEGLRVLQRESLFSGGMVSCLFFGKR